MQSRSASIATACVVQTVLILAVTTAMAGPIDMGRYPVSEGAQAVHGAEHSVDRAWEIYHRAALGGTISSPGAQAVIEQHLHMARTLLGQAQEAVEQGDLVQVRLLIRQIGSHAQEAIHASMERKR